MKHTPWVSLLLAVLHGIAGLVILVLSAWFIAACAVAPAGFNYMLPAVAIRAMALLRIASGYGHMWGGHRDLLNRTALLREHLFNRLLNHRIARKAQLAEALTAHTETIASVWVSCIAQVATTLLILPALIVGGIVMALPGTLWLVILGLSWIGITVWVVISSLDIAAQQVIAEQTLAEQSDAYFQASPIWHLCADDQHKKPTAMPVWSLENQLQLLAQRAVWGLQGVSYIMLVGCIIWPGQTTLQNPLAMIVPMVLLAASDWLGRSASATTFAARFQKAQQQLNELPMRHVPVTSCAAGPITLQRFAASGRSMPPISAELPDVGVVTVTGASGAGKSSLLQAIAGEIPFHGSKRCAHTVVGPGLVAQWLYLEQASVILQATVRENLDPASRCSDDRLQRAMGKVGLGYIDNLSEWLGAGGRSLSGGERKRLALARALLAEKTVLLVDEPFEGLDIFSCRTLSLLFNELAATHLIVIATHIQPSELDCHLKISVEKNCQMPLSQYSG